MSERYVPDTLADLCERFDDASFPSRAPARLLRALAPSPDTLILLDLPGDVAFERKPDDFDAETLEQRRTHYEAALARYPNVVRLDATLPLDVLTQRVVDHALTRTLARIEHKNPLSRQARESWE